MINMADSQRTECGPCECWKRGSLARHSRERGTQNLAAMQLEELCCLGCL